MTTFNLNAEVRQDLGKGASRRLRRGDSAQTPAVVYGGEAAPVSLTLAHKEIVKLLENEAVYASTINLNIAGKTEQVLLKALQRHPYKPVIVHVDFQRVSANTVIKVHVPVHFTNQENCAGVKQGGGQIHHHLSDIEVSCAANALPEFIEVDMTNVALGTVIHLSDLKLPNGVQSVALAHKHDTAVVSVDAPKGAAAAEEAAE
ncbi:MAG: 50S ribosomal protein L25/general stress protein Ctc [Oceanospirillaceae bacterium]|nr:50S ribosomal protein L25/general stress protein Ctc [Oceanospirillaceae bacterium]